MSDAEPNPLHDGESVLRIIDRQHKRTGGGIHPAAFKVRANGKDNNGLSVTRKASRSNEELGAILDRQEREKLFCALLPREIREISIPEASIFLNVISAPREDDEFHALINGTPKNIHNTISTDEKGLIHRVAELLSKIAQCIDLDSVDRPVGA